MSRKESEDSVQQIVSIFSLPFYGRLRLLFPLFWNPDRNEIPATRDAIRMLERTLIIIKPDGVQRHLAGQIIARFESKGLKLVAAKFMRIPLRIAKRLYAVHKGKTFYEGLVRYLSSSPSLVMVWEAEGVIEMVRKMMGATFGFDAQPGTIRGDFSCSKGYNLVHGSDSPEAAKREIRLFFKPDEIVDYRFSDATWLYGKND